MSETIHHGSGKPPGGGGGGSRRNRRYDNIHETPDVSYISNEDVAHEHSDVHVGPIAKFVIGLFIFGVAVHLLMWGLFRYFETRERTAEPPPSPLARRGAERLPPDPRLQLAPGFGVELEDGKRIDMSVNNQDPNLTQPQSEYWEVRKQWERELTTYGWADQGTGAVRLPIEEAKRLLVRQEAERSRANPAAQPGQQQQPGAQGRTGETDTQETSSGQTQERRNQ